MYNTEGRYLVHVCYYAVSSCITLLAVFLRVLYYSNVPLYIHGYTSCHQPCTQHHGQSITHTLQLTSNLPITPLRGIEHAETQLHQYEMDHLNNSHFLLHLIDTKVLFRPPSKDSNENLPVKVSFSHSLSCSYANNVSLTTLSME